MYRGVAYLKLHQDVGNVVVGDDRDGGQRQGLRLLMQIPESRGLILVLQLCGGLGVGEHPFPKLRQFHFAGGAGEQRRAQFPLQSPDVFGESGLAHVEPLRGAPEAAGIRQGHKFPEVVQLHAPASLELFRPVRIEGPYREESLDFVSRKA